MDGQPTSPAEDARACLVERTELMRQAAHKIGPTLALFWGVDGKGLKGGSWWVLSPHGGGLYAHC